MLDRRPPLPHLAALPALLEDWGVEADRYRLAAIGRRRGDVVPTPLVEAAQEVQHDLIVLLDQIAVALDRLEPGASDFSPLLRAQITAGALLESVDRSLDELGEPTFDWHRPARVTRDAVAAIPAE